MRKISHRAFIGQLSAITPFKPLLQIVAICGALFTAASLKAQAPAFLWRTNVGANLLAIDAQANVYANNGSTIITLNSQGIPQGTNVFNQPSSVVQRDTSGNYYFAGVRPAAVSGSGVDYGTTNACFLAKYTRAGSLVWSNGFGPTGPLKSITLTDLQVDTDGNTYIGYYYNTGIADFFAKVAKLDSTGSTLWNLAMPKASTGSTSGSTRVTALSPTSGLVLTFAAAFNGTSAGYQYLSSFDSNGAATVITNWGTDNGLNLPLVRDAAGNFYTRETNITKRAASGAVLWQRSLLYDYPVGADPAGGVYASGGPVKLLTRYDADGNVAWSTNFASFWCSQVIADGSGNQFFSLSDGSIARLAGPLPPEPRSILWRTNVNASVFAVDNWTNIYANTNGTVITLNRLGVPFKTNSYCPVPSIAPGFALRDSSGNFYFAGNFDGTNDFGGKIVVGGWTNSTPTPGKWQPGYPTGFIAKYSPNGALLWATRIEGLLAGSNVVSDAVLNPDDSVTVGIYAGLNLSYIAYFSSTGASLWQANLGAPLNGGPVKLSGLRGTNGGYLFYNNAQRAIGTGHYTSSGTVAFNSGAPIVFTPTTSPSGKPVTTLANEIYTAGIDGFNPGSSILQKAVIGGGIVWTQTVSSVEQWILNGDNRGNLYLSGADGSFLEYNSDGTQIWTTNYSSPAVFGLSDLAGNRVVQFADNTIALISADLDAQTPQVHLNPQAGDGATSAGFQFSLSGNAGSAYQIISSTNLTSWQSMGYVSNGVGDVQIVDPDATNRMWKYYRVSP